MGVSDDDILLFDMTFEFETEGDATFRGYFGPSWYHHFESRWGWYTNVTSGIIRSVRESGGKFGRGPFVVLGGGIEPIEHLQLGGRLLIGHTSWGDASATPTAISLVATLMMY